MIELIDDNGNKRGFDKAHAVRLLLRRNSVWKLTEDSPYMLVNNEFIRKSNREEENNQAVVKRRRKTTGKA